MKVVNLNNQTPEDIRFDYQDQYISILDNVHLVNREERAIINESHIIITMIEQGHSRAFFNGEEHLLEQGDILFCAPGNFIEKGMVSMDFRSRIFILSAHSVAEILKGTHFSLSHHLSKTKVEILHLDQHEMNIVRNFYNMLAAFDRQFSDEIREQIIYRIIQSFAYTVAGFFIQRGSSHKRPTGNAAEVLFQKFVRILKEHPDGRTVQFYAEKLNITPKYFNTVCKLVTGKTASSIINEELVNVARLMLKNHELSIKEVSSLLGFTNQSHFGSFMRRETGLSPQAIRQADKE